MTERKIYQRDWKRKTNIHTRYVDEVDEEELTEEEAPQAAAAQMPFEDELLEEIQEALE